MKKIIYLDSTSLSTLTCPMSFKRTVVDGLVPISGGLGDNYKVAYGSAFHIFNSTWHETGDKDISIQRAIDLYSKITIPEKEWRTVGHLVQVCQNYLDHYQGNDPFLPIRNLEGKPLVEYTFKFPIYEDNDLVIVLFGKIDLIAKYQDLIIVMDHKTTAAYDPTGYFDDYALSPQMMLYTWVVSKMGELLKLDQAFRNPYCVIDGIFLQKPSVRTLNNPPARFLRSNIMDLSPHRGLFFTLLSSKINDIVSWHRNGYLKEGIINKSCAGKWGTPCDYHRACKAPDEETEKLILDTDFTTITYNSAKLENE